MDIALFFRALLIGLAIAAPVGPIGVLCIRRTLTDGRAIGLATGLGAATADATYGGIAAFGLTEISGVLISEQFWLRLIGGAFLCYLGIHTFLAKPATQAAQSKSRGVFGAYSSAVGLTITNPTTIISFAAIFAGLGLGNTRGAFGDALLTLVGVFVGSALWWLILSGGVSLLRSRFNERSLLWVNRFSGVILLIFGVVAVISALTITSTSQNLA